MPKTFESERNRFFLQLLREARTAAGVSQRQLAQGLQLDQGMISRVENGERRLDVVELADWLRALGLPLVDFIAVVDEGFEAIYARTRTAI